MTIYSYGCTGCGVTGVYIQRVLRSAPDTEVVNSKYDIEGRAKHAQYLALAGIPTDSYPAVVVDGETITRLEEWKP